MVGREDKPGTHNTGEERNTMGRKALSIAAALLIGAASMGCAADISGDAEVDITTPDPEASTTIELTAQDYAFGGAPTEPVGVGSSLEMTNASKKELHEVVAFRIADGEKRPIADLVKLPEAEFDTVAEIRGVIIAKPGEKAATPPGAPGDGIKFEQAGRYALVCFIPIGADPDAYLEAAGKSQGGPPTGFDGPPHATKGMFAEITVT